MSRYRTVVAHLEQLHELEAIIASMKTLSQLELHKLGGLATTQHEMGQVMEQVAADFLFHFPQPELESGQSLWLLIGSERGFCGDFNDALIKRLRQACPDCETRPQQVMAVGRKLWVRMEEALPGFIPVVGASVSEELPSTLSHVVAETHKQLALQQATALRLIHFSDEQGNIEVRRMLPPAPSVNTPSRSIPPLLQMPAEGFFSGFLQHYLYLGLTELFTVSLLAENHYRVQHLEGAVRRLDERIASLAGRARALRQEEITEEIETILLGSETGASGFPGSR